MTAYKQQAQAYLTMEQPLLAIQTYESALEAAQTLPDPAEKAKLYEGLGRAQQRAGQNAAAAANYAAAAKLWRELGDLARLAKALSNVANNFATAKNQAAFDYYKQALAVAQQVKDPIASAEILKSEGDLYQKFSNNAAAIESYKQALQQATLAPEQEPLQAQLLTSMGAIYQSTNAAPEAIKVYVQAINLWEPIDPQKALTLRTRLWQLYMAANRYADAQAIANSPVGFTSPQSDGVIKGTVDVQALVMHPQFEKWQLDLLVEGDANRATTVRVAKKPVWGSLVQLDTTIYPNGKHQLRLRIVRQDKNYDEYLLPVTISN